MLIPGALDGTEHVDVCTAKNSGGPDLSEPPGRALGASSTASALERLEPVAGNTVASACSILDDMVQGISDQTGTSPSTWRKRTTDSNMQESNACSQGPCVSDGAKEMARGAPWTEDHEEGDDCWVKGLDLARAASLVESLPPCILSAVGPRHRSTVDSVTRSPKNGLGKPTLDCRSTRASRIAKPTSTEPAKCEPGKTKVNVGGLSRALHHVHKRVTWGLDTRDPTETWH